ncbi:unnamed protein product [Cuscuta europaea]|uniref:Uncharacterized protein n=1 Tax=Cuscuta europaea TaxID=41803 RepID=A0A9P0ZV48_CUSEU|nr:unnamed protein product [Cuscuta europaea]
MCSRSGYYLLFEDSTKDDSDVQTIVMACSGGNWTPAFAVMRGQEWRLALGDNDPVFETRMVASDRDVGRRTTTMWWGVWNRNREREKERRNEWRGGSFEKRDTTHEGKRW